MTSYKYGYLSTDIASVMEDPDRYIIPENRRAIEYLWNKNILTTQTNNYENDLSFINIGDLSPENERRFWHYYNTGQASNGYEMGVVYGGKGVQVPIKPGLMDTYEAFKPLIDRLDFQDVQKDGYMTIDDFFLKYTDCWRVVINPNYEPVLPPKASDYSNRLDYYKAYEEYVEKENVSRKIRVFDENKVTKPLREYLKDFDLLDFYDEEEGKIFYNERLFKGHLRYKEMALSKLQAS